MNRNPKEIDPNHEKKRGFLRTAGVIVLAAGILFLIIALVDFFTVRGFFESPKLFWMFFVALPLIFVGGVMTSGGYMGDVARYSAQEMVPVAKDTFNYMAEATEEGIKTISRAVKEGIAPDNEPQSMVCPSCGKNNPSGAKFCNGCGAALDMKKVCHECGFENPLDANFCNSCGSTLG